MARTALTFKQQDVTRAVRGTIAAGIDVWRVEIDRDGKIVLVTADSSSEPKTDPEPTPSGSDPIIL